MVVIVIGLRISLYVHELLHTTFHVNRERCRLNMRGEAGRARINSRSEPMTVLLHGGFRVDFRGVRSHFCDAP